jgi:hypothetical protein
VIRDQLQDLLESVQKATSAVGWLALCCKCVGVPSSGRVHGDSAIGCLIEYCQPLMCASMSPYGPPNGGMVECGYLEVYIRKCPLGVYTLGMDWRACGWQSGRRAETARHARPLPQRYPACYQQHASAGDARGFPDCWHTRSRMSAHSRGGGTRGLRMVRASAHE